MPRIEDPAVLPGSAELARRAMRLLAACKAPPTPDNYRRAWEQVRGEDAAIAADAPGAVMPGAEVPGPDAVEWQGRIAKLVDFLDATTPGWTPGRKRASLRQLLARCSDAGTLAIRLDGLMASWVRSGGRTPDAGGPDGDGVIEAGGAVPATVTGPADELGTELAALAIQLSESLAGIVRTQDWGQPIVDTVRRALTRPIRAEAVQAATRMLRRVYAEQSDLAESRRESTEAVRQVVQQWNGWIVDLDQSADAFTTKLEVQAQRVEQCAGREEAVRLVGSVVREVRSMRGEIARSREGFERARSRAEALQDRVARLEARLADASRQMLVDELTGALNRRGLEREFLRLERDSRLRGRSFALAMLDIDDFKRLNDELGHQMGDQALKLLCSELTAGLGREGTVARYGGEEFVLLVEGLALEPAASRIGELKARLAATPLVVDGQRHVVRFSAGVTVQGAGDTLESMLRRVDEALYRAKRAGKDCVRCA